ncbi:hypothetical protein [Curtobacterium sp. MCSS17_016]|uniref:hypothetical protein n=1 Tax=Curtobacterium sp. MCSS17_016 TaxID=2175644 RepID=UPI0011B3DEC7|nr:hypothetical protein [Curtobacterium sp. MCSS17_016]WIE81027.1 hypothetical protein DEJ19_021155 [Curtobacterium sp. MCSS17_016]
MTVETDGSGSRVMTATLSAEDTEKLEGGDTAVDTSIRNHLPAELTYSGISPTDDGGLSATFTLTFSSTEDYKQKVTALLSDTASGVDAPEFTVSDSTLVQGITLQESFSSGDLLNWMFTGLVADGVVTSDEGTSDMYEDGMTYLDYGGEHINNMGGQLDYTAEQNHGFDNVTMATKVTDQDHISRTITYAIDPSRYDTDKERLEKFLDDATPKGASVVATEPGTWTMTFTGDATAIQKDTSTALGGADATFTIDFAPMNGDPSQRVLWLNDVASCDAVCSDTASGIITDHVTAGKGYDPQTMDLEGDQGGPVGFKYSPKMTSVTSDTTVNFNGGVTNVTTLVVPNSSVEAVGNGFVQRYKPSKNAGAFTTSKGKNETTYTVTITGDNVDTFRANYAKWNDQSAFTIVPTDSSFFLRHGEYDIDPGTDRLVEGHPVTDGVHVAVHLPFGTWMKQTENPDDSTSTSVTGQAVTAPKNAHYVHVRTSSPTIPGLITAGILAAALTFGIVILVRRRKGVAAWATSRRDAARASWADAQARIDEGVAHPDASSYSGAIDRGSVLNLPSERTSRTTAGVLALPEIPSNSSQNPGLLNLPSTAAVAHRPSLLNLVGEPPAARRGTPLIDWANSATPTTQTNSKEQ